jgi:hypothetical protein
MVFLSPKASEMVCNSESEKLASNGPNKTKREVLKELQLADNQQEQRRLKMGFTCSCKPLGFASILF